jgi:RNA polymerase sigma-70 factor (ECF subfamily)
MGHAQSSRVNAEQALIRRAQRGDVYAYRDLVRLHEQAAFRLAYFIAGQREDAEDACQEAFLRAYRSLHRFRADAPFKNWILKIVANEAHDRRSAAKRGGDHVQLLPHDLISEPDGVAGKALATEARRQLLAAWSVLAEQDRVVIACRYFLDLSERDTAELLSVPDGTIKSRLHRALGRLKLNLEGAT